ncbi:MAG: hypothetical protein HYY01_15395, partial [Chloroflexi bacterium]|nr:hypothetical protein [Chloroflexota bacterium]
IPFDRVEVATPGTRNGSYPTRLIAPSGGIYQVVGHMRLSSPGSPVGAALIGTLGIYRNGAGWAPACVVPFPAFNDGQGRTLQVCSILKLNAGDYLELGVIHNSSTPLQVIGGLSDSPVFALDRISYTEGGTDKTQGAAVRQSNRVSVPHNTWKVISFNTADYNPCQCWSSMAPDRLKAPAAGLWAAFGHIGFPWRSGGTRRHIGILLNGTRYIALPGAPPDPLTDGTMNHDLQASTVVRLAQGDILQLVAYQDSGVALDLMINSRFGLARVA